MSAAALCCINLGIWAQSPEYSWLKVVQTEPYTMSTVDKYYHINGAYQGTDLRAGIIMSAVELSFENIAEGTPTIEDVSGYVGYINMYGHIERDTLDKQAYNHLNKAILYTSSHKDKKNIAFAIYRGGRYTFRNSIPGIGYGYSKVIDILDDPSVRVTGASANVGEDIMTEVHFNTGYPYDAAQFSGNEKASLTLYAIKEDKDGNEIGKELQSIEKVLRLYRPDQPLVAAVDTMKMNMQKPSPGKYRMILNSDWNFEDANTSFILSVNDTLRSTARLDKDSYVMADEEVCLKVTADYGYPYITKPEDDGKPQFSVECLLTDTYEADGEMKMEVIDKAERTIADDSLAVKDLTEEFVFKFLLADIMSKRKSDAGQPLEIMVYIKFNDAVKASYRLPFHCTAATGITGILEGEPIHSIWYDLQGRQLQKAPNRKGLYIRDGKKTIVE